MKKILIIKLGAKGDVIRTLAILPAIKKKYPDSEINWITKKDVLEIFEDNPYISKVYSLPYSINKNEKFDILYNFDIDKEAVELAEKIKAEKKFGFYSQDNFPAAFNTASEYYLNTLFDDELKKTNKKTYQQMMFESAELDYKKEHCPIYLNKKDLKYAEDFVKNNNISLDKLIGIHLGASSRWPSKVWDEENLREFIILAKKRGFEILLFAGPNEIKRYQKLIEQLNDKNIKVFVNNPGNTIKEFSSLVNLCKKMVCSDSFSLHVSLALKKPTIGLFFCTSPNEVEEYGLLKKIISPRLNEFFPEKMDIYDKELTKSISPSDVLKMIEND